MEETFDQKVIRNVQGNFAVYKTTEVIGDKSMVPNLEWSETDEVDKFFMFAKSFNAKVIYIAEGEDINEESGETKNIIVQVGFLHEGIMHHINYAEDEEDEEDDDDEYEYIDETDGEEGEDDDEEVVEQQHLESSPNQPQTPVQQPQQPTQQQFGQ